MNKKRVELIGKGAYIALLILAGLAVIAAMVFGPMGYTMAANTASACACLITTLVLFRTVAAMRIGRNRK